MMNAPIFARTARRMTRGTAQMLLCLGLALGLPAAGVPVAAAQSSAPVQRVVKGKVQDKSGAPIKGAIVYLRDERSSTVKSAISTDDGSYRFVQLSQGTDYSLWAQLDAKKSKTRAISSFDNKNDFTIPLTID